MSKAKNSSKVINWIAGGALAYFIGTAIAGAIKRKRKSTNGVGNMNPNRHGWTRVIFRKYPNGEIIALFPDESWDGSNRWWYVSSYMHNGQHGGANYPGVMHDTKPAKASEYAPLLNELQEMGYNYLEIAKRQ